jgi:glycerophosphoryl diester phosphodiesterase
MPPIVIAHRGASGHRPEHTLAAYELGACQGADYIEPDLVSTRDGHLVARHENDISGTTDVADRPEFAERRATKTIDGATATGWFVEDFTLDELKTLRAKERLPALRPHNTEHDGRHEIPTFQEVIDLAARLSEELGRPVGIYPETKHPTYHRSIGLPVEPGLVDALRRGGLDHERAHVFVQSFEAGNLKALRAELSVPLVQLIGANAPAELATAAGLRRIAEYAHAVGPAKVHIVPRDAAGASQPPTRFVEDAHAAGLLVHPYTFRRENTFLPAELRAGDDPAAPGDLITELRQFFALGVDGVFSDFPDTAVAAR